MLDADSGKRVASALPHIEIIGLNISPGYKQKK
jgi:hypothetical protein